MKRLSFVVSVALLLAAPVVIVAQEPPVYPPEGCVITEGLPAAPTLTKAGGGVLNFTFNSPKQPWTQAEEDSLRSWLAQFVPVMEEVYGLPATSATINIVKDSTISYAGLAGPDTIWLKVSSKWPFQLIRSQGVLVHEIGHAFRDGFTLIASWEEGMARALEVEVHRRLGWGHWDENHSYTYDIWYEAVNTPDLGGNFFGTVGLQLLRYQLAGYAWKKVFLEDSTFFANFNSSLYADPYIRGYELRLIALAASIVDSVEGKPFAGWYERQYVFTSNAPQGRRLHNRVDTFAITAFVRDGVAETNLVDALVYWSIYDHEWALLDSGTAITNFLGVAHYYRWPLLTYSGRGTVVLEMADATSDTALRFYDADREDTGRWGLFGIIEGHDRGVVTVTGLDDGSEWVANVFNGGFAIPELGAKRGRFRVRLTAEDGRFWIRYFNKDASSYFVRVEGPIVNPTQVAEIPSSTPGEFFLAQNYPNPFNVSTAINFELGVQHHVRLSVLNLLGQEIAVILEGSFPAGRSQVVWQANDFPSGIYFYHLKVEGGLSDTRKMILLR